MLKKVRTLNNVYHEMIYDVHKEEKNLFVYINFQSNKLFTKKNRYPTKANKNQKRNEYKARFTLEIYLLKNICEIGFDMESRIMVRLLKSASIFRAKPKRLGKTVLDFSEDEAKWLFAA